MTSLAEVGADIAKVSVAHPVVLFDGLCGMCDASVQCLLRLDRERRLRYIPLQDVRVASLAAQVTGPSGDYETMAVLYQGQLFTRVAAYIELGRHVGRLRLVRLILRVVPAPLANTAYGIIARHRHRFGGRLAACRIPSPEERALFL